MLFILQILKDIVETVNIGAGQHEEQNTVFTVDDVEMAANTQTTSLATETVTLQIEASTQSEDCLSCKYYQNENRILRNKVIDLKAKLKNKTESLKTLKNMEKGSRAFDQTRGISSS